MKIRRKAYKTIAAAVALAAVSSSVLAQSDVTLYGIIDTGVSYWSNSGSLGKTTGGASVVKMSTGVWGANKWGLLGTEDLGSGLKAIFRLEGSFSGATGANSPWAGAMFGRSAYVGFSAPAYGTLTLGRNYAAYYQTLAGSSPTTWLTGYFGAHPGDIDGLDTDYRTDNTIEYQSPTLYGVTFRASYSLGGVAGAFDRGSTWAAGLQYQGGPVSVATAFQRSNNATIGGGGWGANSTMDNGGAELGVSSLTNGYQWAAAQQRFAADGTWHFNSDWDLSLSYSNVQYIPGVNSGFTDTAIFNTGGIVLHWKPASRIDLGAGFAYTRATQANGIHNAASYQQYNLSQYYSLSKRTGLYALEAYQRASGQTLGNPGTGALIAATPSVGDGINGNPATGRSQVAVGVGIVHRF